MVWTMWIAQWQWGGANWMALGALLAGLVSAMLYGRKRRWLDAGLVLLAALALGVLLADLQRFAGESEEVVLASDAGGDALARALLSVPQAGAIALSGHGLRAAQWEALPARPVRWRMPKEGALQLAFPRSLPLGRNFNLTVQRTPAGATTFAGWRVQLLAENGQVLAESAKAEGADARVSVQWLPPLAEQLVLQARVLDGEGKTLAQGPVPVLVQAAPPLQVMGRFGAPSFDTRILNELLTASGAITDWQTILGKGLQRTETARAAMPNPTAQVIDAAWFESQSGRAAMLAQVARGGASLVILGGNAADPAVWSRELGLRLVPQSATTEDTRMFRLGGDMLALAPAGLNPAGQPGAGWQVVATDSKRQPWLWQHNWKQGRILWVGVAGWHRHAITAPRALGLWWQQLLDVAVTDNGASFAWQQPDAMPVAGLRTEICAQGAQAGTPVQVDGWGATAWQARRGKAETVCTAFVPAKAGWHQVRSGEQRHSVYVYGQRDWQQWQQALRHEATAAYMARSPEPSSQAARLPLPAWPAALLFAAAMLALWWRERR